MKFFRLPNGNIVIPVTVSAPGIDAHSYEEVGPDDPRFGDYAPFFGSYWECILDTIDWRSPVAATRRSMIQQS